MATLQKIRNRGKILIFTVGLALFAFIAEEFVRSLSYTQTERHQRVGKIYGEKINVQEFNAQVEEYTDVVKFTQGVNTLSDDQISMMRDQVWQTLVNDKLMEHECEKLGITVTDAEMQDIINNGRNPMLAQTPFRTAQGTFDVNALKQFLNQYSEVMTNPNLSSEVKEQYQQMNNYWKFIEKTIRRQTLNNKYQSLLNGLMVSNPVAAQASFDGRSNESDIYMAALPFTSIKDDDVKVEDSDLKAKYEEMKEMFRADEETRDIKYIDINVTASEADKADLREARLTDHRRSGRSFRSRPRQHHQHRSPHWQGHTSRFSRGSSDCSSRQRHGCHGEDSRQHHECSRSRCKLRHHRQEV